MIKIIIQYEILNILSDNNIHYFQEIVSKVNDTYHLEHKISIHQIHYQLSKMIKENKCKRICNGLYQKI